MYSVLKSFVKSLLPRRVLFAGEPVLRLAVYQLYRGNRYACPVCSRHMRAFIDLPMGEKLCPACGSLGRGRRLWQLLHEEFYRPGLTVLDFSPSRSLYRALKQDARIHYESTDLSGDFMADQQYDITRIDASSATYDLILCYHILEHIPDDRQAMRELRRVLKPCGICLIQTPFREGGIYENEAVRTDAERLAHFGQADHVRVYSVAGLTERLQASGFRVQVREFQEATDNRFGFKPQEVVLVCS
ncbi:class I SAM-dependent methyltransferase [Hymenobacter sp. BT18]|uniref:class I SAM-dependent methyltransferase n=1 Tax=Hymenobacter sp. BT18 TaxID=2835648 RepID=UPI00143ECCCC|nr:methyltransferase domain-containing protein [Hymenobacter sp. BT18]QIX62967.1 class I SAM-dependent methyltransferase [Hymenobacter sp. BT18]